MTWMMKMIMGSLGLYLEGLAPSMTPACDGALLLSPVAAATADDKVEDILILSRVSFVSRSVRGRRLQNYKMDMCKYGIGLG